MSIQQALLIQDKTHYGKHLLENIHWLKYSGRTSGAN